MFSLFKKQKQETSPEVIARGHRAHALLNTQAFQEALVDCEEDLWATFFQTSVDQPYAREDLYVHIQALQAIKHKLESWSESGKYEQMQEKGR